MPGPESNPENANPQYVTVMSKLAKADADTLTLVASVRKTSPATVLQHYVKLGNLLERWLGENGQLFGQTEDGELVPLIIQWPETEERDINPADAQPDDEQST